MLLVKGRMCEECGERYTESVRRHRLMCNLDMSVIRDKEPDVYGMEEDKVATL